MTISLLKAKLYLSFFLLVLFAFPAASQNPQGRLNNPVINTEIRPENFGAVGDGKNDDTKGLNDMVSFALSRGLSTVSLTAGKQYHITQSININFLGKGQLNRQGIKIDGNNASIFLDVKNGDRGYWAINIVSDSRSQQNTRIDINNIWFYTDNKQRPNGIHNSFNNFVTVSNCMFYQVATAILFEKAGMCRFNNNWFWGCVEGIITNRMKDTYIDGCHAYGCERGFLLQGSNDSGADGNVCITNSVANQCVDFALKMKGLYTPMITNSVFETSHNNIIIESCQYGKMSNVFCGPGNLKMNVTTLTNDYWNISNLDCQGDVSLQGLKFSTVTGLTVHNGALNLNGCNEVVFNPVVLRSTSINNSGSAAIVLQGLNNGKRLDSFF